MNRLALSALCALLLVGLAWPAASADSPPFTPEYEKSVGEEAIAEVEAKYERYKDDEIQAKLDAIVAEIAALTSRPDVTYDVRLLDTKQVNAFSLPGGTIYVTKGLLDEVQSDHELAAVVAHEIAHNCTYDALVQAQRNKELFTGSVAAALIAILLGAGTDEVATVLIGAEYVRRGVLGGYSIDMERMADRHGGEYLLRSDYSPVGLLTFMERLAAKERRTPTFTLGVFQTHPLATERVERLADYLQRSGVDLNRRATTRWDPPKAEQVKAEDKDAVLVSLWGEEVFLVMAPGPDHGTLTERGEAMVQVLTRLLADGLAEFEVRISQRNGNPAVVARGEAILVTCPEDAQARGLEQAELVAEARDALKRAFRKERYEGFM